MSRGSLIGFRLPTGPLWPQFPCEHNGGGLTARWLAANSKVNFCTRRCLFWKRRDPLLLRSDSSSIIRSWGTLSFLPRSSKGTAGRDQGELFQPTYPSGHLEPLLGGPPHSAVIVGDNAGFSHTRPYQVSPISGLVAQLVGRQGTSEFNLCVLDTQ